MWLRVEDGGTDAVGLLRVTLSGERYREGQNLKASFGCIGIFHKTRGERIGGYACEQKKMAMGPRNDEGPQLELQQGMMANFWKRKKEREAGNLAGSEEDGDVGGAHLCFPHPSSSFSYDVPASLSKT